MTVPNEAFDGPVDIPPDEIGRSEEFLFAASELLGMTLVEMTILMYSGILIGAVVSMIRYQYYQEGF